MKKNSILELKDLLKIKEPIYVLFHSSRVNELKPYLDDCCNSVSCKCTLDNNNVNKLKDLLHIKCLRTII